MSNPLASLAADRQAGLRRGITSVCSAHPTVITTALARAVREKRPALIEATCNQVNQEGGYTGMTPADFRDFVAGIAAKVGATPDDYLLGGDHLGPNPWRKLPARAALERARTMVAAYVDAGYGKIHLDASMGCADDPVALADEEIARRAASLAVVAEAHAKKSGQALPYYIIGTEVPTPGGALESLDHMVVTDPANAARTVELHRQAFKDAGVEAALERVIGLVVQPGVEFGHDSVVQYAPDKARALSAYLDEAPGLVFEAHSTDYQTADRLRELVEDGFPILKVGPGLTFALREALYGLDAIALALDSSWREHTLAAAMEHIMTADPGYWRDYYQGDAATQRWLRHYSYSDRIRYYWTSEAAGKAVGRLLAQLGEQRLPEVLISQYLGRLYRPVVTGEVAPTAASLVRAAVDAVLEDYAAATRG
ncbi:tagatose-bisphosphate aldolase noncatalytic subunit [Arboricoccus pini]|uniref:Tagatose-bisphosphate aldolase noncatalytic subunit n=1 Tax=Arboricoccus pini TaxID=1963835 RepID=A0A212RIP0_9PROT|nr:D-tagatose-bisphosphate aldolase, class II, non-catalytic subunit [Arboricoccus pini]SNB72180.1 tagatose-bisphosphate aldolase noncatalytic subunit [Arboricoccus pini]